MVGIGENLALFMELQTLGDRFLRKLAFSHIVHSIRRMNQKHKNEVENRALQNILFSMLQVFILSLSVELISTASSYILRIILKRLQATSIMPLAQGK